MTNAPSVPPIGLDRRTGDRRSGQDRRGSCRSGVDRRRGDRRAHAATLALGATLLAGAATPAAADIYTRRSDRGVIEATNINSRGEGFKLAYRSKGHVIHSAAFRATPPVPGRFESFIQEASARHNVSAELVRAVIRTESAFDHLAVSSVGARGLMQLMPATARRFGVQNAFDPRDNIHGGVRYLRVLLDLFRGDVPLAVAAYNAGEGAVARYGGIPPYRETRDYVRKIQGLLARATPEASTTMASYTPGGNALSPTDAGASPSASAETAVSTAARRPAARAKPRILYRWRGANGVVNVAEAPPPDGVEYTTLRSTD
jgi:hypothetical protein